MSVVQKVIVNVAHPKPKKRKRTKRTAPKKKSMPLPGQIGSGYAISALPPVRYFPEHAHSVPTPQALSYPQAPVNMFIGGTTGEMNYAPTATPHVVEITPARPKFGGFDEAAAQRPIKPEPDEPQAAPAQAPHHPQRSPVMTRTSTGTLIQPPLRFR